MTEQEWLDCAEPRSLLEHIRDDASYRKRLLFAAACFWRLIHILPDIRQVRGIEMLEEMADGEASAEQRREAIWGVRHAWPAPSENPSNSIVDDPHYVGLMLYRAIVSSDAAEHAIQSAAGLADGSAELRRQTAIFHDIFGNPFRPVTLDPRWQSSTVLDLARTIYDQRSFEHLPILADALMDAGCDNDEIIKHCQGPGPHVRGCWVVDLLLGKA